MKIKIRILTMMAFLSGSVFVENSSTSKIQATAKVSNSCQFLMSDVVFGEYNPGSPDYQYTTQNLDIDVPPAAIPISWREVQGFAG